MKIDRIEVVNLRFDYPVEQRFRYAGGICTSRVTSLVLVHTDSGQVGLGSVYSHPGLVKTIIEDQLTPLLRGRDACEVAALWDLMYRLTRWYGRKGAAMSALGGVDTALWDLYGKKLGKPVWQLLGGRRDRCPAYASALLWNEVEQLAEEAARHLEHGFRRMKMRLGRSIEYDTLAVETVRRAIGFKNDLMVDASMRYDIENAQRVATVLQANDVFWYEEPFAPEDLESYRALRPTINVPLAAGENEFGLQGFRELIRVGAVDIVQPDAARCGGISEVQRIAREAERANLRVATHTWNDAVTVVANAHVIAAAANGITVEVDQTGNPFIDRLLTQPLQIEDGQLHLGNAPGLGIELNHEVVEQFRMSDSQPIPPGNYSDMVFGTEYLTVSEPYKKK